MAILPFRRSHMRTLVLAQLTEHGIGHGGPQHGLTAGYIFLAVFAAIILVLAIAYFFRQARFRA